MNAMKSVLLLAVVLGIAGSAPIRADDDKKQTPTEFLSAVINCNLSEKDLAEKAVKNAQSADVRKFAQRLVDDHTANNKKAMHLAKDLKMAIVTGTSKEHRDMLLKLLTTTGKNFDQQFLHYMVDSHQKAIKMFEHCAKDTSNAEIRAFANQTLPTLREHLKLARQLEKNIDNK